MPFKGISYLEYFLFRALIVPFVKLSGTTCAIMKQVIMRYISFNLDQ